ncbi:MAG: hypothetical protein KJN71_04460 [Acidimicrobiia bacterium]|nr:hypothetical protein [Acidimicrobiia bacterium]
MRPNKPINSGSGKSGFTKGRWTATPVAEEDTDEDIEVVVDDTVDDEGHRTVPRVEPEFSKWDLRPSGGPIATADDADSDED